MTAPDRFARFRWREASPRCGSEGLCAPNRIAYDGGELFWVSHSGYVAPNGYVERVNVASGAVDTLASGLISPDAIAIDASYVYAGGDVAPALQSAGRVLRIDRASGEQLELAISPGRVADIALDADFVYWTSSVGFLNGNENSDSAVMRVSKNGGAAEVLASGLMMPAGLARSGTRLFVAHSGAGAILSLDATGGAETELASGLDYPQDVAVADGAAFFSTWGDPPGALYRVALPAAAAPTVVAPGVGGADQIALGSSCVYWTEQYTDDDFNGMVRRAGR
ncbi:MAG: hypothetical protein EXR75_12300 [Myxococcales bacterium]|nr:hypothetical protein [Myxococcales bacterium]